MSFLGISKSYTNKQWVGPSDQNWQKALLISKDLSISQLSAYQLIKNKINEKDYLGYISPKIKNLIPYPKAFLDMEKGSLRLLRAIEKKERIAVFADYDVDGTVSAALICLWLRNFSIEICSIPSVFTDLKSRVVPNAKQESKASLWAESIPPISSCGSLST